MSLLKILKIIKNVRTEKWSNNKVYYRVLNKEKQQVQNVSQGSACYSGIQYNNDYIYELLNFRKEETQKYIKNYVTKLSNIFKCNLEFVNDNIIHVNNFKSRKHLLLFLTMFRYLFENQASKPELNEKMIRLFVEDNNENDLLSQFILAFNKACYYHGNSNHCISEISSNFKELRIRTNEELMNDSLTSGYSPIHQFFKK